MTTVGADEIVVDCVGMMTIGVVETVCDSSGVVSKVFVFTVEMVETEDIVDKTLVVFCVVTGIVLVDTKMVVEVNVIGMVDYGRNEISSIVLTCSKAYGHTLVDPTDMTVVVIGQVVVVMVIND